MAANKKDPQEDIKKISAIINSGEFKNVHLLYGDEDYLRKQFTNKLVDALVDDRQSMNFDSKGGKDVVPEQIIDLAETMPFFADKRVILLEDTGWFKGSADAFTEYIKGGVCDTTYIIFSEKEIDKRGKLYKAVESAGVVSEFMRQDENTLAAWITKQFRDEGLAISGSDVRYFLNVTGDDMISIQNEMEKVIGYSLGRDKVTRSDIDAVCSRKLEDRVFEMCEKLALRNQKEAMMLYYDLVSLRESPIKILVLVTRQYNMLLQIKDMELNRKSDTQIGSAIGRPPWTIKNYRAQTSRYKLSELKEIVNKCADLDMNIKSGKIADNIGIEMLLVELSKA